MKQYKSINIKRINQPSTSHQNIGENTLGLQLKTYRQKLGLTLEQTAEELEISAVYVSMIEREKRIPSEKIANRDRKSTRLNSSHVAISYAVFCLKKKKKESHVTYTNKR